MIKWQKIKKMTADEDASESANEELDPESRENDIM